QPERTVAEFGKPGHHDYWFKNENNQAVTVGLRKEGCGRCGDVKVFLAPDDWRSLLEDAFTRWKACKLYQGAFQTSEQHPSLLGNVANGCGIAGMEYTARGLLAHGRIGKGTTLSVESSEGVTVPPGAFGFVRIEWEKKR